MKLDREVVREARTAVDEAIEMLERVPRNYGGHRSADSTSTIDGTDPVRFVEHQDGRLMQFVRMLDPADTPYATALAVYRGRWLVVPAHRLRAVA